MAYQGEAFAPGHVTAFFVGHDDPDPRRKGSRGAGLCISLGVRTEVRVREAREPSVATYLDGEGASLPTTASAMSELLAGSAYEVRAFAHPDLPVSHGFGLSGAGALGAVLAVDDALGLGRSREELVAIAHAADVTNGTGLGDVVPQSRGGIDLRVRPGAPPHGLVRPFPVEAELMVCAIGPAFPKGSVLGDPATMERIARSGEKAIAAFESEPSLDALFSLGTAFARETGLMSPKVRDCLDAVRAYGKATMSMLGNSVVAVGGEIVATALRGYGTIYRCKVDNEGARVA